MFNSKLKQIVAAALVAQGVYMTSKALMKSYEASGKLAKEKTLNTPASPDDAVQLLETKTHEINHVYQKIKPILKETKTTRDLLLTLNRIPVVAFETESHDWEEDEIEVSYPEKETKRVFYKLLFKPLNEAFTNIVLRLFVEDWSGYVDVILYRCISKVMTNQNYLQVVHSSDIIIDSLLEDDIIILERINKKLEGSKDSFVIVNKESGESFVSKNYHNI